MKVLITGATGFIGGNVARAFAGRGYEVRALLREGSSTRALQGLDVELAYGDLRDPDAVKVALQGCDYLCHTAALYSFWTPDPELVYATNVQGTANVLRAARNAGVAKVVYTSSESTIGIAQNGVLGTEAQASSLDHLAGHYKKSKLLAEEMALGMAQQGLPLVVVNPTVPVGRGDVKPTPTGHIVVDFLQGKMPAYVNTGLNLVDVEDVAEGHVLALEKGRVGERYILGNKNLTLKEVFGVLEKLTGIRAPRIRIPIWLALSAAHVDEFIADDLLGRAPSITVASVKTAAKFRYFDCSKAVRELGLPQTPIEEAFAKAVNWFRENGYAA